MDFEKYWALCVYIIVAAVIAVIIYVFYCRISKKRPKTIKNETFNMRQEFQALMDAQSAALAKNGK